MRDYNISDLRDAYENIGVSQGGIVYVTGNFGRLGRFSSPLKEALFKAHLNVLSDILGKKGTLVVPTHSFSLANNDMLFDYNNTSSETGPFTEYIRQLPGAVRQYHPFSSSTAVGGSASSICGNCSRHVYGLNTPFHRMVENDALFISLGKEINTTISLVHHAEFMMGVPYRYTKEFWKSCRKNGEEFIENFYLHVLYSQCDIARDRNIKITESYRANHSILEEKLGRSYIYSVSMKSYFDHAVNMMSDDIYAWLKNPPMKRPYLI